MKLRKLAGSAVLGAVLAAGAIAATPANAAHLTFDINYTSASICPAGFSGSCTSDPGFQPFSRTLTYQVTSVQHSFDDVDYGPGGYVEGWSGQTSINASAESPEILAAGGYAPQTTTGQFRFGVGVSSLYGFDETDFNMDAGPFDLIPVPGGMILTSYDQLVRLPGGFVPGAPSSPLGANGFLDYLASLGPFEAFESGFTEVDVLGGYGSETTYTGTATLDRGASDIPEPSAWALMIAGFGLAGVSLRRRAVRFA